ncbi:hypothetical protein QBC46DRAFT_270879 [Diplogelasinospora grovesii]|uniref:Uncharacterized protein n=1 Tax=Diplogelasinospora grovesii TaxID=303347 RepID=A0AAN6S0U0_9PEZI|nr:hypothetical protein QBC46DRAFT_270879 [Diplogelasinospora grovesii]
MDLMEELLSMAQKANVQIDNSQDPCNQDIIRWQFLFGYSRPEAVLQIKTCRNDLAREHVSASHWNLVRGQKEHAGYDKEAYEHSLALIRDKARSIRHSASATTASTITTASPGKQHYLLKLDGPMIGAPAQIANIGSLPRFPVVLRGTDSSGGLIEWCKADGSLKELVDSFLDVQALPYALQPKATYLRYPALADKDLDANSPRPCLGVDTTLPQYRPSHGRDDSYGPRQEEYPVFYFLWDELVVREHFVGTLHLPARPGVVRHVARICGGKLRTLENGRQAALVDSYAGSRRDIVSGAAYLIRKRDEEEALRVGKGDKFEVVRCWIELTSEGCMVPGLTFRFVGGQHLLD